MYVTFVESGRSRIEGRSEFGSFLLSFRGVLVLLKGGDMLMVVKCTWC
jgi:hypothetical protein